MGRVRQRAGRPVRITDAQRSQEDQLRTRQTRYILMMSVRVLAVIAAAVLVNLQPPLLWFWLALCGLGMIVVPWVAVMLANDRLPKERHRWRGHRPVGRVPREVGPAAPGHTIEADGTGAGVPDGSHAGTVGPVWHHSPRD
jgi:hypothetical protein